MCPATDCLVLTDARISEDQVNFDTARGVCRFGLVGDANAARGRRRHADDPGPSRPASRFASSPMKADAMTPPSFCNRQLTSPESWHPGDDADSLLKPCQLNIRLRRWF